MGKVNRTGSDGISNAQCALEILKQIAEGHAYICMYAYTQDAHMYVCVCEYMHISRRVCVYVWVYIYICVCVYVYVYVRVCRHVYMYISVCVCKMTRMRAHARAKARQP